MNKKILENFKKRKSIYDKTTAKNLKIRIFFLIKINKHYS